ncbi:MAG: hypothetical protein V7637_1460 [Mycobacteriales bacterium]
MSRGSGAEPSLLVRVAVAALVGGAIGAAALALTRDVDRPELVAGLVLVVAAASVLAVATLSAHPEQPAARRPRPDDRTAAQPFPPRSPARQPAARQPASSWPGVSTSPAPGTRNGTPAAPTPGRWDHAPPPNPAPPSQPATPPMSVAIPVPGGAWWQAAEAGPSTPAAPAHSGPAQGGPAELSDHAAAIRVVQCPRCGNFGVDVHQQESGFAFTCNRCERHWRWEPGSAWPVAVVRPRQKGSPAPGLPPEPS